MVLLRFLKEMADLARCQDGRLSGFWLVIGPRWLDGRDLDALVETTSFFFLFALVVVVVSFIVVMFSPSR